MSSYFPFDGISPIAQFLQDKAGDMYLTGIDSQGRPFTQAESECTQTQFSTESGAHTYLETVFTQASAESAGPTGHGMPDAPVGCPRVPIIADPYGPDDPQSIPTRGRSGQSGQSSQDAHSQSVAHPSQQTTAGINNPGLGPTSSQSLAPGHPPQQFIPGVSPLAPPQSTAPAPVTGPSGSQDPAPSPARGKRTKVTPELYRVVVANHQGKFPVSKSVQETGLSLFTVRQIVRNYVHGRGRQPAPIAPPKGKPSVKSEVLPIMRQILERHPTLSLVQVARQLVNHGHFLKERTVQTWMSGEIIGLRVMTNQVVDTPIANISDYYEAKISELVKDLSRPSSPDVIFLAYYKVAVSHQDFGQPRGANNKPKKGLIACFWKGVLLAAGKNGIRQITISDNSHSGYSYTAGLEKLLADYAAKAGVVTFAISAQMEKRLVVEDRLKGAGHTVVMYPENHSNLHLADVLFFNMGTLLRERHNSGPSLPFQYADNIPSLFPPSVVEDMFSEMLFFASSLNPHTKSSKLPPANPPHTCSLL